MERRLAFVHAHPDDESIATGALMAHFVDSGHDVSLLTASRGEMGEVVPGPLARLAGTEELVRVRESELREALNALGVTEHAYLGTPPARVGRPRRYLDSGMEWIRPGLAGPAADMDPQALCAADPAEVASDLGAWLRAVAAEAVITYDADGGYGHPDHVRCHEIATHVGNELGIPVYYIVHQPGPGVHWFDLEELRPRLEQALRAHATQVSVEGENLRHSGGQVEPIRPSVGLRRAAG